MVYHTLRAGQRSSVPYLSIPELMHPLEKVRPSSSNRRELNLMVFMRLGHPPVVITITGSDYPGMPPLQQYHHDDAKHKLYVRLSSLEYIDCLKKAMPEIRAGHLTRGGLRSSRPIVVCQDEATPHISALTAAFCANYSPAPIRLITLPTESPDLTPCDSCFFAVVKRNWQKLTREKSMSWQEKCRLALELTQNQDSDPFIKEVELRWLACQKAKGGHIEQELKLLKKQQQR